MLFRSTCVDGDNGECAVHHDQMVTLLLHLRHVDASQINSVAKSLISKDGDVAISNGRVTLHSTGRVRLRKLGSPIAHLPPLV